MEEEDLSLNAFVCRLVEAKKEEDYLTSVTRGNFLFRRGRVGTMKKLSVLFGIEGRDLRGGGRMTQRGHLLYSHWAPCAVEVAQRRGVEDMI